MAVNTLTGYLLLSIDKPVEALEFITIAERIAYKLIEKNLATQSSTGHDEYIKAHQSNLNNLEVIGEDDTGRSKSKRNMHEESVGFTESMHASPREETKRSQHAIIETERRRDRSNSSNNRLNQSNKRSTTRSISREEKEDIEDETYTSRKKSRMSATLLSNFVLGITLLKNISLRFSTPGKFYDEFDQSMN